MVFGDTWLFWIVLSSLGLSLYDLSKKASVKGNAVFPTLFISSLSGLVCLSVFLFFTGRLSCAVGVEKEDIGILFLKSCIVGASWTATYFALKTLPITCAAAIRSTGPLWTFIGAVILFSEVPTALQGVGMVLVMGGCLFFSRSSSKEKSSGGAKAVALAFLGTVLGSCSALYDKYLLQGCSISSLTLLWWFLAGMCVIFAVAAAVTREKFEFRWTMPLTGIMLAFSDACYFNAIADPDSQISVLSLIRRSSIVLTFFIGGAIFHEGNLKRKSLALAAILVGVLLLCLFTH
jgi:drug/metabolite transporter (DMT)-like permease